MYSKHIFHEVVDVSAIDNYHLILKFNDGTTKIFDMRPLLWGEVFAPLRTRSISSKYTLTGKPEPLPGPTEQMWRRTPCTMRLGIYEKRAVRARKHKS